MCAPVRILYCFMAFSPHLDSNGLAWMAETMSLTLQILLSIVTIALALAIGLLFRRLLLRRLQRTILDKWIIQTLGIIIVFPPVLLGAAIIPLIWNPVIIFIYWDNIQAQFLARHIDLPTLIGNIIQTLLLITLGIGIARTVQALTIRGLGENRVDINLRTLIGRIFYILTLILTVFWILSLWSVSLAIPVAAISVITLAVTFSIQDILKDLVCGFYILLERPFHIGDHINTAKYIGQVEDVQLRATRIRLISGEEATIPNSLVFGSTVINHSHYGERRATITATLANDEFVWGETTEQLIKAIQELKEVMVKPEPEVVLIGYTAEQKVKLLIRFWVPSGQLSAISDVVYTLHKVLPNAELTVSEPDEIAPALT
jgi:small-conductance mechanosensitive channel